MSISDSYLDIVKEIVQADPRYPAEAYYFIHEALSYTAALLKEENQNRSPHLAGPELLAGIRKYAVAEYGPMAFDLFQEWGINSTENFGHLVFNMVAHKLLSAREEDKIEDFVDVYDFRTEFILPFLPSNNTIEPSNIA